MGRVLELNLEDLKVQSFATTAESDENNPQRTGNTYNEPECSVDICRTVNTDCGTCYAHTCIPNLTHGCTCGI
ncbi:MAG: pinensin family lanthipeptide [Ignavibacteria bacterium]|jgi:hypothetical protein